MNSSETKNLQDNKPFALPISETKFIVWSTRSSSTVAEDANEVIDESLIWQHEVFRCALYDGQCRKTILPVLQLRGSASSGDVLLEK